jgi:hypothetical protein
LPRIFQETVSSTRRICWASIWFKVSTEESSEA